MNVIRHLESLPPGFRRGALAIGNFDGVHRGHARIMERLIAHARRLRGPAVVFTFDPHPVRLLRPHLAPPPLTWTDRKARLLAELGVDGVVAYPTDLELLSLLPEEFYRHIVRGVLDARAMVEGPNFFFGRDRVGDVHLLDQLCRADGLALEVVPPVKYEGRYISSSRVRDLIVAGRLDAAREMLTHPYRIRGMVTHGAGRGVRIGFPTANVHAIDTLLPGHGVYAGIARVDEQPWPAAVHIGANPTFAEHTVKVEVHLIGFDDSLYGCPLEVDFLDRVRDIQTFPSLEALQVQLDRDIRRAAEIVDRWQQEQREIGPFTAKSASPEV